MSVARGRTPARSSSAPMLWRLRHSLGRVWFTLAVGTIGLGLFVAVYAVVVGPMETIGIGLTLVVGGLLLAVGFRPRRKGRH